MEKISGILPATRRIIQVDLSEAQPLRPGVPSFGRPVNFSGPHEEAQGFSVAKMDSSQTVEHKKNLEKDLALKTVFSESEPLKGGRLDILA